MDVAGKTAIVTGSAVGVGRATANRPRAAGSQRRRQLLSLGGDAREAVKLVEAEGARALLVKADVSKDDQVQSMVQQAVDAFGACTSSSTTPRPRTSSP